MSVCFSSAAMPGSRPAYFHAPAVRFGISHVLEAGKQKPGTQAFDVYVNDMARNASKKARFFARSLSTLQTQPSHGQRLVFDIGCCGGDMIRELERMVPDTRFMGMDMNFDMLTVAREKDRRVYAERGAGEPSPGRYMVADGFELPLARESVDAFTLSSLMHEIFSYAEPNFSYERLGEFFDSMHEKLKPGGRVVIRDPGRPDNPDELMTVQALPDLNMQSPADEAELMAIHPGKLGPDALLRRFLLQFKPAQGQFEKLDEHTYRMPAWLVSEFLRHRKLNDTAEHWDSEMHEQYGVFTSGEMERFAIDHGYIPKYVESAFDPNNHAANYEGEFIIRGADGQEIDQARRLPTHLYVELEKPRTGLDRLRLTMLQAQNALFPGRNTCTETQGA